MPPEEAISTAVPVDGSVTEVPAAPPAENAASPVKLTAEQERARAIELYHDAPTRAAKAAVVAKYPVLKGIYSEANHS